MKPEVRMPTWTADIDIDVQLAARLIRAQFVELAQARVEAFGFGWDNAAFIVQGDLVFRFPRRRICAPLLEREIRILPHIAAYLPLTISSPTFLGHPSPAYPWPFAGYPLIRGKTACSQSPANDARAACAAPLAHFLRALHTIPAEPLVARGLVPDDIGRLDHHKRLDMARRLLPTLAAAGIPELTAWMRWLETHPPLPLEPDKRRLVHGDLYARHIVLDAEARLAGIIDWGDVHLGDPAIDLAIAFLFLPPGAHAAFRDAYGAIDERTWTAARFRAIYHALVEIEYGIREDDAGMRAIGSTALEFMRVR